MLPPPILDLQSLIARFARCAAPLRVLEAGCGSLPMAVELGDEAHLVGIDISERQLRDNSAIAERILGDVQTHAFPPGSFDVIFCWDVLEHLPRPVSALDNFRVAARADGLIVLKLPNILSAKGLVTKFTPHRFHVWVYRKLLGYPNAGKDGYTPFRAFMRWSIAPHRIAEYALRHGLSIEYEATYEADRQTALRERLRLTGRSWRALSELSRRLTRGMVDLEGTELIIVLRNERQPAHTGNRS